MGLIKFLKDITKSKNQPLSNNYNPNSTRDNSKQTEPESKPLPLEAKQTEPTKSHDIPIQYKIKKDISPPEEKIVYKTDELVDMSKYEKNFIYFNEWNCPYCKYQFDKSVRGKRKCPECKNTIFVRYHYVSREGMLLTEDDDNHYQTEKQDHFDLNWCLQKAQEEEASEEDIEMILYSNRRGAKFDVLWGLYNKKSMEYASNMQWGLYRNNRLSMADVLEREGKKEKALTFYLMVALLDINGANNTPSGLQNPNDLERFPAFNLRFSSLPPGIKRNINNISSDLSLPIEKTEEVFKTDAAQEHNRLMPLTVDKSWEEIYDELTND